MSSPAVNADPDVISKGEFARRRGVSPGRVSQWISEKKISGAAIVGQGRNAQIQETVACAQLRVKLDPMQMTANGLGTNLAAPALSAEPMPPMDEALPLAAASWTKPMSAAPPAPTDTIEEKIKLARLEQIERQNREGQRAEAVKSGMLTHAELARSATVRETSRLVTAFEGALSEFATAISAEFKLPQRDVLHLLRGRFRDMRRDLAAKARDAAQQLPATISVEPALEEADEMETA